MTGAHQALLGRPAIEVLKAVKKVNEVEAKDFKAEFPKLFKRLGKLDGPDYVIKLKPAAKPHALCTPKRVPVPLLSQVREELYQMEQMDLLTTVVYVTTHKICRRILKHVSKSYDNRRYRQC